jgi:DNA-binding NarL/FixJ family response regulator
VGRNRPAVWSAVDYPFGQVDTPRPDQCSGSVRIPTRRDRAAFTDRELDVVRCIARGEDNHAIAGQPHISPHTVKFHVTTLLRRHGLHRRTELVALAMRMHLLD